MALRVSHPDTHWKLEYLYFLGRLSSGAGLFLLIATFQFFRYEVSYWPVFLFVGVVLLLLGLSDLYTKNNRVFAAKLVRERL